MSSPQRMAAKLSLTSLVVFGVAYMAPSIVILTFGVIASRSHGSTPTSYLIAGAAMALTALSYGKLARIYPSSGSAYTYARKMINPHTGFLVGWAILLDYFFLPMVAWLVTAVYISAQFPSVPLWIWLVLVIAVTTAVNILGIVLADRVNKTLLTLTLAGMAAFVVLCVKHLIFTVPSASLTTPLWNSSTSIALVSSGAAVAAYSFLGFDAISTLSEETINPKRNIPRGILLVVVVGTGIFVVVSYIMQLVHPGGSFKDPSSVAFPMFNLVGGPIFANIVNIVILAGSFASCIAVQASTSRLMFVMGRDGVLPRGFFGRLHPKLKTPTLNLLLVAVVGLIALVLSVDTATSFINFGAFLTFTMVNICVIVHFWKQRARQNRLSVMKFVVLPLLGATVDFYLLTQLGTIALYLGLCWLALGILYLAVLTRGFRKTPPEMSLESQTTQSDDSTLTSS
ncbi:APC family permease [Spelaeicoccus albus]|uniref:Amino acid transporter n=1 Tax=Spelaeicoccus albus TaxID=1280376 RepID=A0A7Z0D1V2_9MICO|nr:APC family permease [Spelaeicoccus albus]NYI66987.1 amino acid transporter [Spelaeicoccus albus]